MVNLLQLRLVPAMRVALIQNKVAHGHRQTESSLHHKQHEIGRIIFSGTFGAAEGALGFSSLLHNCWTQVFSYLQRYAYVCIISSHGMLCENGGMGAMEVTRQKVLRLQQLKMQTTTRDSTHGRSLLS